MRHEYVVANGIRFHYVTQGEGPLLVLLHGFPQFWYTWRRQIPELAKRFRVVAPDMRGYGDTDKPPRVSDYRPEVLSADIAALIRALGAERALLAGHDWGGGVAWGTALDHPEVVEKLAILNCPHPKLFLKALGSNPAQMLRSWYIGFFQLPWLPERMLGRDVGGLIAGSSTRADTFTAEDRAAYQEAFHKPGAATASLNYYRALGRDLGTARKIANDPRKVSAPTLVIWGDKDQALGKELTEGLENVVAGPLTIRHLPDASHWVHEEQPEEVNRLLFDFLTN